MAKVESFTTQSLVGMINGTQINLIMAIRIPEWHSFSFKWKCCDKSRQQLQVDGEVTSRSNVFNAKRLL